MIERSRRTLVTIALGLLALTSACKKQRPAGPEPLSQAFTSKDGKVTVHYPASFAGKAIGNESVMASRGLGMGHDEAVTATRIEKPITDDLKELDRVLGTAAESKMKNVRVSSKEPGTCQGNPAIATRLTFTAGPFDEIYDRCVYMKDGHAFALAWMVTRENLADEEPTLRAIRDGVTY